MAFLLRFTATPESPELHEATKNTATGDRKSKTFIIFDYGDMRTHYPDYSHLCENFSSSSKNH